MRIFKSIKFTSLVETAFGPIRVSTTTEKWWLTALTLGLFRKMITTLSGPAFRREEELIKEWEKQIPFPPCRLKVDKTHTFCAIVFRFDSWHEHMLKYAKMAGEILSERDRVMQLYYSMQEAWKQRNIELVHKIAREIRGDESQHWRKRRRCVENVKNHRKNRPYSKKETS